MLIAMVHYHLNRGGVTQVIANHLRALQMQEAGGEHFRVVVLHGGRCAGWPDRLPDVPSLDYSVHVVPGLDYDDQPHDPRELATRLQAVLREAGGSPDASVIHVHNHALGKNPTLPGTLCELARDGWALLLQIHDFAEDFRAENYRRIAAGLGSNAGGDTAAGVYPSAAHVHYAVLNQRDARILSAAGAQSAQLHVLPNAAGDVGALPLRAPARRELARRFGIPENRRLLLYPVRGIRRKNLGEALLWSALAGDGWQVGLTLSPLTSAERPSYERWKTLAASLQLPMAFEIGEQSGLSYVDNLAVADRMLTTSVAEGFGLVFLEAWLVGKTLVGRDLPEITADFVAAGLRLEHLRPRLNVPLDWIGAAQWRCDFEQAYTQTLVRFGHRLPLADEFHRVLDGLIDDGLVDFGALSSRHQQQVVSQVAESDKQRQRLRALNGWIENALGDAELTADVVAQNAAVVRATHSLAACGQRLSDLYREVAASPRTSEVRPLPRAGQILDEFLQPERFQPIRVES